MCIAAVSGTAAPRKLITAVGAEGVELGWLDGGLATSLRVAWTVELLVAPAVPAGSLVFAFFATALVLYATGHDAISSYRQIVDAAFLNSGALGQTLTQATPLGFTGLAAAAACALALAACSGETTRGHMPGATGSSGSTGSPSPPGSGAAGDSVVIPPVSSAGAGTGRPAPATTPRPCTCGA